MNIFKQSDVHPYPCQPCLQRREPPHPDCERREPSILCTQSQVSRCEAHLFCETSKRLIWDLERARNLCELKQVVDLICCLLSASAAKETSLAKLIAASKCPQTETEECCCKND